MIHPKVKVPAVVLAVLSLVSVVVTAIAGSSSWPWATGIAGFVATLVGVVTGYLTPAPADHTQPPAV